MSTITLNNAHATMRTDTASSHVATIKRLVKFAGALALIAITAVGVAAIKLAIYYPHNFH
jgi:hypothetical protein